MNFITGIVLWVLIAAALVVITMAFLAIWDE